MCVLSPGLFWGGGGVNNVLLYVSMKYCASCLLWGGGGRGGNNVLLSVSMKYSVFAVSYCLLHVGICYGIPSHPRCNILHIQMTVPNSVVCSMLVPIHSCCCQPLRRYVFFFLCLLQVRCSVRMSCVLIFFFCLHYTLGVGLAGGVGWANNVLALAY